MTVTRLVVIYDREMEAHRPYADRYMVERLDKAGITQITKVWRNKQGKWTAYAGINVVSCRVCRHLDTVSGKCTILDKFLLSVARPPCLGRHFEPKTPDGVHPEEVRP